VLIRRPESNDDIARLGVARRSDGQVVLSIVAVPTSLYVKAVSVGASRSSSPVEVRVNVAELFPLSEPAYPPDPDPFM
jgi:hypothetical protein